MLHTHYAYGPWASPSLAIAHALRRETPTQRPRSSPLPHYQTHYHSYDSDGVYFMNGFNKYWTYTIKEVLNYFKQYKLYLSMTLCRYEDD